MTQDIKELAHMMGEQFAATVKLCEKADAEEIDSIVKSMDQSYQIYATRMNEASKARAELLAKLDEVFTNEAISVDLYTKEVEELRGRLEAFKKAKLGTKVSDEAVAQRARDNSMMGMNKPWEQKS